MFSWSKVTFPPAPAAAPAAAFRMKRSGGGGILISPAGTAISPPSGPTSTYFR